MNTSRFLQNLFKFALVLVMLCASACERKTTNPNQSGSAAKSKKINIISNKNGVGLSQDVEVLQEELTKLGHQVSFIEDKDLSTIQRADINVLIQPLNLQSMPFAERNYLIPNAEWCWYSAEELARFDRILCKTREAERIFLPLNSNSVFMGFTCKDRFDSGIKKDFKAPFHLVGKSTQKGTDLLVRAWWKNPQWPLLTLVKAEAAGYPSAKNIDYRYGYLPFEELKTLQNRCGLHVCPSETEGFGYYIMEGLSTGAVVVTTDAPPMNEFVKDPRCLVGQERNEPMQWAVRYFVDPKKLDKTITDVLALSEEQLQEIGKRNREFYLENDRNFKLRVAEIFSNEPPLRPKMMDPVESVFSNIYTHRLWGENPSGSGSRPENTKLYRYFLQDFMGDHQIHSVVEIGSGAWEFSRLMDWKGIHYIGYDICKELVEVNQKQFGASNIEFRHGNALRMDIPSADLLICKDVLQHLPNQEILLLSPQLGKYKHVLLINDVDSDTFTAANWDVPAGSCRSLDLTKPPFNLKGEKCFTFTCGGTTKQVLHIRN